MININKKQTEMGKRAIDKLVMMGAPVEEAKNEIIHLIKNETKQMYLDMVNKINNNDDYALELAKELV